MCPSRRSVARGIGTILNLFPLNVYRTSVERLVIWRARAMPPDEGLRFLFELDRAFYVAQSELSVAYGRGTHPKHDIMRYHDFFVERVRQGEHVLDFGCGIGAVAYDIASKAKARVWGVDISAENIAYAQKTYSHPDITYILGDARQVELNTRFDAIVMSNVLEHLTDRPATLRQLQVRYQPSRFLIRVPLFNREWRVPLKKPLGVEWRLDPTHEIEYTIETFADEIAEAGLITTHQQIQWGEIWAEVTGNG